MSNRAERRKQEREKAKIKSESVKERNPWDIFCSKEFYDNFQSLIKPQHEKIKTNR